MSLEGYPPFAIYVLILTVVGLGMLGAASWLGPKMRTGGRNKLEPWECGVEPLQTSARERFAVPFYLVAILFILFDLETVFLFPWATVARPVSVTSPAAGIQMFLEIAAFVFVLTIGLIYVWKRRGLEWD